MMEILEHNTTDESIRNNVRHGLWWLHYLNLIEIAPH